MTSDVADREETKKTSPVQFMREVRAEARKVTWATRGEVTASTIIVLIMALLAAIFFFLVDGLFRWAMQTLLSLI